ncbi:MAG: DUF86 domain-containing protein [Campylobacterales bacterium]|nr:DUF86 domain-containing protein [Campylobacterales bacterium]
MYDKEIVLNLLENMIDATQKILYRNRNIQSVDDYLKDDNSLMLLDSLCMQLIAIGEAVKKIDKETNYELLKPYTQIPWREVAGMRDILSHHYFDLNAEVVFEVTTEQITNLQTTLKKIVKDIK